MGDESAERCETCKCWKRTNEGYELGLCRAHPPAIGHHPGLPETKSDEWCGEWKAKDDPRTPLPVVEAISESRLKILSLINRVPGIRRIDFKKQSPPVLSSQSDMAWLERRGFISCEYKRWVDKEGFARKEATSGWYITEAGAAALKINGAT